jgi:hypothetical protein
MVLGAAAVFTAGIAALVSAVAPGHSLGAQARYAAAYQRYLAARAHAGSVRSAPASATAATSASSNKMPPLASPSSLGLSAGAPPQAAPTQPQPAAPQAQPAPVQQAPAQAAPVQVAPPPPVAVSGGS